MELDHLGLDKLAKSENSAEKLLHQLKQLKGEKGKNEDKSASVYEIMLPQKASKSDDQRLALLDERLNALEKVLGEESMPNLTVETTHKSLLGAVSHLGAKMALLDPLHLDHIEGRLASLQVIRI